MGTNDIWREQTLELLARVRSEIAEVEQSMIRLRTTEWGIEQALKAYDKRMNAETGGEYHPLTPEEIGNKSQKEILEIIAHRGNGILLAKQAVRLMKDANLFPTPENASSQVYNVLRRNSEFVRVRKGVYRLASPTEANAHPRLVAEMSLLARSVAMIRRDQPNLSKEQITKLLIDRSFPFHGKEAAKAVNMAIVNLDRRKKNPE